MKLKLLDVSHNLITDLLIDVHTVEFKADRNRAEDLGLRVSSWGASRDQSMLHVLSVAYNQRLTMIPPVFPMLLKLNCSGCSINSLIDVVSGVKMNGLQEIVADKNRLTMADVTHIL